MWIATQQRGLCDDFLAHADKGNFGFSEFRGDVFGAIDRAGDGSQFRRQGYLAFTAAEEDARDKKQHDYRAGHVLSAGDKTSCFSACSEMTFGHSIPRNPTIDQLRAPSVLEY